MVMRLRAGAAMPDKEPLADQIGPSDGCLPGETVLLRQDGDQRLRPDAAGIAVGQLGRAGHENYVEHVGAKLHDGIAGRALGDLDLDAGVVFPKPPDQLGEEAARDQGMDADTKPTALAHRRHACGLHRMVELVDACGYPLDEVASGLGQPSTPRMALEQKDAKVFFQRLHAGADAGLRHAERIGGVAEVEVFGDGERLDQRRERDARSECGRHPQLTIIHRC